MDRDFRGGAALSTKMVTGKPLSSWVLVRSIMLSNHSNLDRIASRILDRRCQPHRTGRNAYTKKKLQEWKCSGRINSTWMIWLADGADQQDGREIAKLIDMISNLSADKKQIDFEKGRKTWYNGRWLSNRWLMQSVRIQIFGTLVRKRIAAGSGQTNRASTNLSSSLMRWSRWWRSLIIRGTLRRISFLED